MSVICRCLGDECECVTLFTHSAPISKTLERNTLSTSFIILSSQLSSVYSHLRICMHTEKEMHTVRAADTALDICKACQ